MSERDGSLRGWSRSVAGTAVLFGLAACGGGAEEPPARPTVAPPTGPPSRPLRDVLGSTLAELGVEPRQGDRLARELRENKGLLATDSSGARPAEGEPSEAAAPDPDAGLDPDLVELREGLLGMVRRDYRDLETARGDLAHLGAEVVPVLVAGLRDLERDPTELRLLGDLACAVPDRRIAGALMSIAATHDEAWLRRYFAWLLASVASAPGAEAVVPELLLRLKYERDDEAFVWLGKALAVFGNYSGMLPLFDLAGRDAGQPAQQAAFAELTAIAAAAPPLEDGSLRELAVLQRDWESGDLGRREPPDDGLRAQLWLYVADLSGEHFQLRGVDDARFVLSRLGPWAGAELALAMEDDDEYVRLHVAQVLERMGPRGRQSFDSLVLALRDPHGAVAGAAAEALVAVAGAARAEAARAALETRLDEGAPFELRVAITRALGRLGDVAPVARLQRTFEEAPASDLKLAAASGLLALAPSAPVLDWLADEMEATVGDPAGAESVTGAWLASFAGADGAAEPARTLLEAWRAESPEASLIHTQPQARARRAARAAALRSALSDLLGP